jgi:hypothetical protein
MRALVLTILVAVPSLALADGLKNLQVLPKTTTKEEVKQIMRAQSRALDVECDFCHEVPDMASDANKMKKIAREMMKMQNEINDKWLTGMKVDPKARVTCGTCHRGKQEPPPFEKK